MAKKSMAKQTIRHLYRCRYKSCKRTMEVDPELYSYAGAPECEDCGDTMVHVQTKVNGKKIKIDGQLQIVDNRTGTPIRECKKEWKVVPDPNIRHLWQCREEGCNEAAEVSPEWYQNNGTPVCGNCDCDMIYVRTEVLE